MNTRKIDAPLLMQFNAEGGGEVGGYSFVGRNGASGIR